jgi:lipoate-protein ligase B
VVWYVDRLEEVIVRALGDLGVRASTDRANRGVWVGALKIAALGVKVTQGITMHGFALNVRVDLDDYRGIVPCGIADRGVTSLHLLVADPSMAEVKERVIVRFGETFGYREVRRAGRDAAGGPAVAGGRCGGERGRAARRVPPSAAGRRSA